MGEVKITFVLPHAGRSGGIKVLAIYAKALVERGHDISVVSVPAGRPSLRRMLTETIKGRARQLISENRGGYFDDVDVPHKVLERQRPVVDSDVPDADVVVATWWETVEWVAKLSPSKGSRAHLVQHHEVLWYDPGTPQFRRAEAVHRLPFHHIAVSRWLRDVLRDTYGQQEVDLVANSVDQEQFHAPEREKLPIPAVGLMFSDVWFKGSKLAADAIAIARRAVPELCVVAFGGSTPSEECPLPPGAAFSHRPEQDEIRDVYAACDAWLFCSKLEGFGLPILEAMACRTPVIGTPAGAAPECIEQGGGILVKQDDPEDMARAIIRIARMQPDEWKAMSDAAIKTVRAYTWDDATSSLEGVLERAKYRNRN